MSSKKRGADIQLTREQGDEDEIEEVTPAEGFRKADDSVIASRPMRGLPKRNSAFGGTNDALSTEKKPNFAFGAPISSNPFTFNASLPTSASASSTTQPTPASSGFKFSAPAVSSSASLASRQLSSLLGSAPQPNGLHGSAPSSGPSSTAKDSTETKYYTSLRGLNQTLKEEISKRLNSDPFADLEEVLHAYKTYRTKIQNEYDASKPQSSSQTNGTSPLSFGSKSAAAPTQPLSMPTPPKSFAGFGPSSTSTPSTSSSVPATGGFKPNLSATSSTSTPPSTFAFGVTPMKTEKTTSDPSLFGASSSTTSNAKPSPFGASATTNKPSPFGGPVPSSSPFGFSSTSTTDKPFSLFGSGTGTSSSTKADTPSNTTTAPPNIFGGGGITDASGSGAASSSTQASTSFNFGGAKSPSSGNLGNPFGFSFGSNETTPTSESSKESAAAAGTSTSVFPTVSKPLGPSGSSGFSFSSSSSIGNLGGNQDVSAKSSAPGSVVDSRGSTPFSTEGGEAPSPAEDASTPKPLGENPNDLEGEGEENEETLHISRVKIYRFGKNGDQPHWADIGVGMLRIKKHKETNAMRLLSRNSANGKIMMNFRLYTGFKVSRAKQVLNFVGHDEGANATFRVRVKDEAGAIELQEAIERAVSLL